MLCDADWTIPNDCRSFALVASKHLSPEDTELLPVFDGIFPIAGSQDAAISSMSKEMRKLSIQRLIVKLLTSADPETGSANGQPSGNGVDTPDRQSSLAKRTTMHLHHSNTMHHKGPAASGVTKGAMMRQSSFKKDAGAASDLQRGGVQKRLTIFGGGTAIVADQRPLLLLLDDMPLDGNEESVDIIQNLFKVKENILVIISSMEGEASFLTTFHARRFPLAPLTADDTQRLVTGNLRDGHFGQEWYEGSRFCRSFTNILHEIGQGVPALMERMCVLIKDRKMEITTNVDEMREKLSVADTLSKALCLGLIPLNPACLRIAQCASVLGRRFNVIDLRAIAAGISWTSTHDMNGDIASLIESEIFVTCQAADTAGVRDRGESTPDDAKPIASPRPPPQFLARKAAQGSFHEKQPGGKGLFESELRFKHPFVMAAVYDMINPLIKKQLHKRAALFILNAAATSNRHAIIAQHFSAAGEVELGVKHYELAGDAAMSICDFQESRICFTTLFEVSTGLEISDERSAYWAMQLGITEHDSGHFDEAIKNYSMALGLLQVNVPRHSGRLKWILVHLWRNFNYYADLLAAAKEKLAQANADEEDADKAYVQIPSANFIAATALTRMAQVSPFPVPALVLCCAESHFLAQSSRCFRRRYSHGMVKAGFRSCAIMSRYVEQGISALN